MYVASTPEGRPSRIGYASELWQAINLTQHHCPMPIWAMEAIWVPDKAIAAKIAKKTQGMLADRMLHGGWVDEDQDKVIGEMNLVAFKIAPNATMVTHDQLVAESKHSGRT